MLSHAVDRGLYVREYVVFCVKWGVFLDAGSPHHDGK